MEDSILQTLGTAGLASLALVIVSTIFCFFSTLAILAASFRKGFVSGLLSLVFPPYLFFFAIFLYRSRNKGKVLFFWLVMPVLVLGFVVVTSGAALVSIFNDPQKVEQLMGELENYGWEVNIEETIKSTVDKVVDNKIKEMTGEPVLDEEPGMMGPDRAEDPAMRGEGFDETLEDASMPPIDEEGGEMPWPDPEDVDIEFFDESEDMSMDEEDFEALGLEDEPHGALDAFKKAFAPDAPPELPPPPKKKKGYDGENPDVIYHKKSGVIRGKITQETDNEISIKITMPAGNAVLSFNKSEVSKIERGGY